ncbi:MAG: hypothetical protein VW707_05520 [Candidatus Puniceispirillum sp.]|jgi:hypothetical protein
MTHLKTLVLICLIAAIMVAGALYLAPYLKPNNTAFAPDSPSPHVSKRLKGIFKGMNDGFTSKK